MCISKSVWRVLPRCLICITCSRFDGRGHLYDLRPYDADINKPGVSQLSSDEQRIERLCDEERYLELHTDIAEKAIQEGS